MISQRVLFTSGILLSMATVAPAIAAPSFSGIWALKGGTGPICTISQKGSKLSGDCKNIVLEGPVSGSIDGSKLKWIWTATSPVGSPEQGSALIEYTGQLDSNGQFTGGQWSASKLTGGMYFPTSPTPFTATRQTTSPK